MRFFTYANDLLNCDSLVIYHKCDGKNQKTRQRDDMAKLTR